ncbi:MAG: ATP-binding protein [Chloroflexota bacterium]
MSLIFSLINETPFLMPLSSWAAKVGFVIWLGITGVLIYLTRKYQRKWQKQDGVILGLLVVAAPVSSFFIGLFIPEKTVSSLPDMLNGSIGVELMLFSALPWVLAAGLLGPFASAGIAALSGLILGLWSTHSYFTPIEFIFASVLFSLAMQQRFRTLGFKWLRHPLIAAIGLSIIYPLIYIINMLFVINGLLAAKLDFALTHVVASSLVFAIPLIIAGIFCEFLKLFFTENWGAQPPWEPSPAENNLESRFFYFLMPLLAILLLIFIAGDWFVAGNAAERMLRQRMETAAEVAVDGVPYFLDTGQSLILQIASDLSLIAPDDYQATLEGHLYNVPYFHELFVLDDQGNAFAGYPQEDFSKVLSSPGEQLGIDRALNGVPVQVHVILPLKKTARTQISFVASITDLETADHRVLIGRTDFAANPFTKSIRTNLNSMDDMGGYGLLVDENGSVLYHADAAPLISEYTTHSIEVSDFYHESAPDGTRQFVYVQPLLGRPWAVIVMVPAQQAQQLALDIATPLLLVILILSVIAAILLRVSLRVITSSLRSLTNEAERISQGQLDHSLQSGGHDEVGRLRYSFEQMRLSLKARLDELNRLLLVSQGVASSLEIETAVKPILESALSMGATSARIVLTSDVVSEIHNSSMPSSLGLGRDSELFSYFDDQILAVMIAHGYKQLVLTNPTRTPLLEFGPDAPHLGSLLAVSLFHEHLRYGVLWLGYGQPHTFSDEEVQFLTTIAGQAALAASNAHLFMTAEFERGRLAAILASTPDPVLVTDQLDQLLLVNRAAWQALGMGLEASIGQPVEDVITQDSLIDLLRPSTQEDSSIEISLPNGRFYFAAASTIEAESQQIGRVCVLRDVTHFKELDSLKSEFVATVSHDLRSPLTLMRGYATMLDMVGDLNPQQTNYVRKIDIGIERITHLISSLLDIGRIEAGVGLQLEMLEVSHLIDQVIENIQGQADQKRVQLQVEIPQLLPQQIEGDQALLQQAVQKLVENAVKYTSAGGAVWVRVTARNQKVIFAVQDTGIGVSPIDQPRLFEKFYRSADRHSTKDRGTGLGLAIVKSIVERHQGSVGVESQLGTGSIFYFEIPIHQTVE